MEKTKLGLSVNLFSAIIYFVALFGGFFSVIILMLYIFLKEESTILKKNVLRALLLLIIFSAMITLVGILPSGFAFLDKFFAILDINTRGSIPIRMLDSIGDMLGILKNIVFLLMGFFTANHINISVPFVDKKIEENF